MRPARKGPENLTNDGTSLNFKMGFNEAGPQGAGKLQSPAAGAAPPAALQ